jgi:hypothetical protein
MSKRPFILAVDPGNKESAFCLCSPDLHPLAFGKIENGEWLERSIDKALIDNKCLPGNTVIVIEDMESFGMPVGRSVLDTERYIGELTREYGKYGNFHIAYVYRHEEKRMICHSAKANDATIKQALVDRFAPGEPNYGKGTKKAPGFFYGFYKDVWSAFAQCVTYHDKYIKDPEDLLHLDELPF